MFFLLHSTNMYAQNLQSIEFAEHENNYIATTLKLMTELGFVVRDTFKNNMNLDDFYSNGNKYNGARLFRIKWIDTTDSGYAEVQAKRAYKIKNYSSQAYDDYTILMLQKYKAQYREDPIIHECVHFLQHATHKDESNYIDFTGKNYREYVMQRTELEAHLVQILYIVKNNHERLKKHLSREQQLKLEKIISEYKKSRNILAGVEAIIMCKQGGLI